MQKLMRKTGQRMIIVLIIALLLTNLIVCNSTVYAGEWTKKMSIQEYMKKYAGSDGTIQADNLYEKTDNGGYASLAISDTAAAWGISEDEVVEIMKNHESDEETLTVYYDGMNQVAVKNITIKPTEAEKTKYGITTDSNGNASVDTRYSEDFTEAVEDDDDDDDGFGGILMKPITALICGIGDACNNILQRLMIGEKTSAFISRK